ncbi:MAG: hypothetical protein SFU56_09200, partial [Capsulimonadales bacterium]|nr:hypothetical protein [Capsulimonadales bacterium]
AAALATDAVDEIKSGLATETAVSGVQTTANTINSKLGAITGSGLNTVLGFFRALASKAGAILPTDIGGTFDNTTDSLEAIRERGDAAWGGGGGGSGTVVVPMTALVVDLGGQVDRTQTDLILVTGDHWNLLAYLKRADGAPFDASGASAVQYALIKAGATTASIGGKSAASGAAGAIWSAGQIAAPYTDTETATLTPGRYYLQVKATVGDVETTGESPVFTVRKGFIG